MEWIVTHNRKSPTPLHIDTSLVRTRTENSLFGIFCKISETNNQLTLESRIHLQKKKREWKQKRQLTSASTATIAIGH